MIIIIYTFYNKSQLKIYKKYIDIIKEIYIKRKIKKNKMKNPGTVVLFISSFGLLSSSCYRLFGLLGLINVCLVFIVLGIWLFKRRGYWVNLIPNIVAVCINKNGRYKVMTGKRFFVSASDKMRYLNSGPIEFQIKTCQLITKENIPFYVQVDSLVKMKEDEKSILDVATTKKHGQHYQDYIVSNEPFKRNKEMVEAKLREFVSTKTFEEINPVLHKKFVIDMLNDLFVENFMVVKVMDIEVVTR